MVYGKTLRTVLGFAAASTMALSTVVLPANAQANTTATLAVTPGALTMYAADATDNNDLCANGSTATITVRDDSGVDSSLTCTAAEQAVNFAAVSVLSTRQTTDTILYDTLFEDLTGSEDNIYNVSVTFGNLENQGTGADIVLGANPDLAGDESAGIAYAPTGGDAGKLFCYLDPATNGSIKGIAPGAAGETVNQALFTPASASTILDNVTASDVFGNASDAVAGRYDIDAVDYECRLPAYLDAATYTQVLSYTVAAS